MTPLLTAAILATGCSAASPTAAKPSASATSASVASNTSVQLLGPQLAAILLPKSAMPQGYSLLTKVKGAVQNSGKAKPHDATFAVPANPDTFCQIFSYSDFLEAAGMNAATFAQTGYSNKDDSAEIDQSVNVFTGSDAQTVMRKLWAAFGKCNTMNVNGMKSVNALQRDKIPGVGDEAIAATLQTWMMGNGGGTTFVAVRVRNAIVTVVDLSPGMDLGNPARGYAKQLTARLNAAVAG